MSVIESTAFVANVESRFAVGLQRFVRHVAVPDSGNAITWDHPESFADNCDHCRVLKKSGAFVQLQKDAPLPGDEFRVTLPDGRSTTP